MASLTTSSSWSSSPQPVPPSPSSSSSSSRASFEKTGRSAATTWSKGAWQWSSSMSLSKRIGKETTPHTHTHRSLARTCFAERPSHARRPHRPFARGGGTALAVAVVAGAMHRAGATLAVAQFRVGLGRQHDQLASHRLEVHAHRAEVREPRAVAERAPCRRGREDRRREELRAGQRRDAERRVERRAPRRRRREKRLGRWLRRRRRRHGNRRACRDCETAPSVGGDQRAPRAGRGAQSPPPPPPPPSRGKSGSRASDASNGESESPPSSERSVSCPGLRHG